MDSSSAIAYHYAQPDVQTTHPQTSSLPTGQDQAPITDTRATVSSSSTISTPETPPLRPENENDSEERFQTDHGAPWQPLWLKPSILSSFCGIFFFCTVALPLLLLYSKHNNGIIKSSSDLVYVWRFGPTAVITIIGLFWSRVELQTLRYMPWMALQARQSVDQHEYALDYTSMLSPTIIFQSLRRRHCIVFLITAASLILQSQVVLASSFFQLRMTTDVQSAEVQILDSFKTDKGGANNQSWATTTPYFTVQALRNFNMKFPFGVTKEVAYQTFDLSTQRGHARGAADAPLTVTVDGAFMDVQCLELESFTFTRKHGDPIAGSYNFTVNLHFENCDQNITLQNDWISITPSLDLYQEPYWKYDTELKSQYPCSRLPRQHPSFLYYAALYESSPQNLSVPFLTKCAALLCSPIAWISKVKIVDDGISPNVTVLPDRENTTIHSNPWTMLEAAVPVTWRTTARNDIPGPLRADYDSRLDYSLLWDDLSLYSNKILRQAITNLTESFGPMLLHYQLRQTKKSQVFGSLVTKAYKLHVNELISLFMTGLFAVLMLVSFWTVTRFKRISNVWARDPATILGSMLFFHSDTTSGIDLAQSLSGGREKRKAEWAHTSYSPIVVRVWARSLFAGFALCLIIGLIVMLNISEKSGGLATIYEHGYFLLLWTSLPTFAMLVVSSYINSTDTVMRDLAVLSKLSYEYCDSTILDISLLDMIGLRALYQSIRLKAYPVTLSQSLATICAFITSFAAILLTTKDIPKITYTTFQQTSQFGALQVDTGIDYTTRRPSIGSLMLMANLSNITYPQNSYADLAFPELEIDVANWTANISAQVRTPAAKLLPTCVRLSDKDMNMSIYHGTSEGHLSDFWGLVDQPSKCQDFSDTDRTRISFSDTLEKNGSSYFGQLINSPEDCATTLGSGFHSSLGWSLQTYIWGKISFPSMQYDHLSIWRCNYTWVQVTTDVRLIWENHSVMIDHLNPPIQDSSTIIPWDPPFAIPSLTVYPTIEQDPDVSSPSLTVFSAEFTTLLKPFGPIQATDFGKLSQDQRILEALHANAGFAAAQLANVEQRVRLNKSSSAALPRINATITNHGRLRLVQNPTITYILIAIISIVFITNVWALVATIIRHLFSVRQKWLLELNVTGLAPENFNSIAMMESLVHDSNTFKDLPKDLHLISCNDLHKVLAKRHFTMGWFLGKETDREEFTIGVLDDERFPFIRQKK